MIPGRWCALPCLYYPRRCCHHWAILVWILPPPNRTECHSEIFQSSSTWTGARDSSLPNSPAPVSTSWSKIEQYVWLYRVFFLTVPTQKFLCVRLHSKFSQKSSKCQNLLTDWHLEFFGWEQYGYFNFLLSLFFLGWEQLWESVSIYLPANS